MAFEVSFLCFGSFCKIFCICALRFAKVSEEVKKLEEEAKSIESIADASQAESWNAIIRQVQQLEKSKLGSVREKAKKNDIIKI